MVNVERREDWLIDQANAYLKRQKQTKDWLDIYLEANMISPEVASHLWEVLSGITVEVAVDEN